MQVNIDPLKGIEPYTYTVTSKRTSSYVTVTQVSNNIFTGLLEGTYDITVTDAIGCFSAYKM